MLKTIVVGAKKGNHNYKKIEGFFEAFKQISDVKWLSEDWVNECKYKDYDVVFGEFDIKYLQKEKEKLIKIKSIVT